MKYYNLIVYSKITDGRMAKGVNKMALWMTLNELAYEILYYNLIVYSNKKWVTWQLVWIRERERDTHTHTHTHTHWQKRKIRIIYVMPKSPVAFKMDDCSALLNLKCPGEMLKLGKRAIKEDSTILLVK